MIPATARAVSALAGVFLLAISNITYAQPATRRADANGNPIRTARTGHVSNYDEAKVGAYTRPDPLVMADGRPVRDGEMWFKQRRPEILKLYETEIYGRVPANAPKVTWEPAGRDPAALDGTAMFQTVIGRIGEQPNGPRMNLRMYTPAAAKGPVPMILCLSFFGPAGRRPPSSQPAGAIATTTGVSSRPPPLATDPIADILARGWGYATIGYLDIQPDSAAGLSSGVIGLTLATGQAKPAVDQWGAISAWAWGVSRIVDYFETNSPLDAKRVAIMGHSRLGKTVLWAGAQDPRITVVYSSCSGEMGASLARRDWGETVDDMAQNFPYQFCGNFQKYAGHWNEMPVDAHMLIALNAPHAVFVTGGTGDQWADPKGEFLAEVAAGAVYRLVGKKDLGTSELPPLDVPVIEGDLGWHYHTGGHAATAADWKAFLEFAGRHFR
jgi:hypothetical protein